MGNLIQAVFLAKNLIDICESNPWNGDQMEKEYEEKSLEILYKKIHELICNAKDLQPKDRFDFCKYVKELFSGLYRETEQEITPHPPESIDLNDEYPGLHKDALVWLKEKWGKYLKYYGAETNSLYQDQLWKLDEKLMSTITRNRKYKRILEEQGLKVRDIIPRKSERITKKINETDENVTIEHAKTYWATKKRKAAKCLISG